MIELLPYDIVFMDCEMPEMDGSAATVGALNLGAGSVAGLGSRLEEPLEPSALTSAGAMIDDLASELEVLRLAVDAEFPPAQIRDV